MYTPPWFLWCSNYWKMHLSVKYLLCPLTKLSPSFLLSPPRHREIIHSSLPRGTIFMKICSPACRKGWGGDYTQPITLAKKGISIRWKYSIFPEWPVTGYLCPNLQSYESGRCDPTYCQVNRPPK